MVQLLISRFKESKCSYIPGLYFVYTVWNILLLNNSVWDSGQISLLRHNLSIGGWLLRVSQDCYPMAHQTRRWSELIAFLLRDGEGGPCLTEDTENMSQSVELRRDTQGEKRICIFFFHLFLTVSYSGTQLFSMFSLLTWPFLLFEPFLTVNFCNFTLEDPPYYLPSNRSSSICHLFLLSIPSSVPSATKPILKSSSEGRTLGTFALYLGKFTRSIVVRNGSSHDSLARAHDSPEKGAELTRSICLPPNSHVGVGVKIRQLIKEKLVCVNSSYFQPWTQRHHAVIWQRSWWVYVAHKIDKCHKSLLFGVPPTQGLCLNICQTMTVFQLRHHLKNKFKRMSSIRLQNTWSLNSHVGISQECFRNGNFFSDPIFFLPTQPYWWGPKCTWTKVPSQGNQKYAKV